MPSTKDEARVLGSGDPDYQEEARQDAIERAGGEENYEANPELYWTAQQGPMPDVPGRGPQVYLPEQLPDPEVAKSANFTPQFIPATIVAEELEPNDPKGPEPSDRRNIEEGAFYDWSENAKAEAARANPLQTVQGAPVYEEGGEGEEEEEAETMTKAQLVDRARELGIEGFSSMNKAELEDAVAEYDG